MHRQKYLEYLKAKELNDPKAFWIIINRTTKHPNTGNVTIDEFFEHFSVLNATEDDECGVESRLSESQIPSNVLLRKWYELVIWFTSSYELLHLVTDSAND